MILHFVCCFYKEHVNIPESFTTHLQILLLQKLFLIYTDNLILHGGWLHTFRFYIIVEHDCTSCMFIT